MKLKEAELRRETDVGITISKEKDTLLKRYRKLENVLKVQGAILPSLQNSKDELSLGLERMTALLAKQKAVRPNTTLT